MDHSTSKNMPFKVGDLVYCRCSKHPNDTLSIILDFRDEYNMRLYSFGYNQQFEYELIINYEIYASVLSE